MCEIAFLQQFISPISGLAKQIGDIPIRDYETSPVEIVWTSLYPDVVRFVHEAKTLMSTVLQVCGESSIEPPPLRQEQPRGNFEQSLERDLEQVVEISDLTLSSIEDVAFLVRLDLSQRHARLQSLPRNVDLLGLLTECDRGLRRCRKGLAAVDWRISRVTGKPPALNYSSELHDALCIRESYAKFRAAILQIAGNGTPLYVQMRSIGTQIAKFVGWKAYPLLRTADRLQLRGIQTRILGWLRHGPTADELAGQQLWNDILSFVELLQMINRREELVVHDNRIICELLQVLPRNETALEDPELQRKAKRLIGLDHELDQLLLPASPSLSVNLRNKLSSLAEFRQLQF